MIDWRSQSDKDIYEGILIPKVSNRQIAIFVGAGLSVHAGYPLLKQLIVHLHEKAQTLRGEEIMLTGDWKQQVETCFNMLGEAAYQQVLIDRFSPQNNRQNTTAMHIDLVDIPFCLFITTNYDSCIQKAFEREEKEISTHFYPALNTQANGNPSIYHLHGYIDPENPHETVGSIVLTSTDFQQAYESPGAVRDFLIQIFEQYSVLFLGFGFDDEELLSILETVKRKKRENQTIAQERRLPRFDETSYFALLENKVIIQHQTDQFYREELAEHERQEQADYEIRKEDAYLSNLGIQVIRFNAGDYYKSVENIISNLRTSASISSTSLKSSEDLK